MLGWIAEKTGGLIKDIVNITNEAIGDIASIGDRFEQGYDDGLITDNNEEPTNNKKEKEEAK